MLHLFCSNRLDPKKPFAKEIGKTNLSEIWTALAFPSEIKKHVKDGIYVPVFKNETPRVLNWYKFTDKGIKIYKEKYDGKPDYFA